MPTIACALGASPVAMQQALTVYLFCYGLMMLWYGGISDALGRKPVIVASTLVFTLASLAGVANPAAALAISRPCRPIWRRWLDCWPCGDPRHAGRSGCAKLMSHVTMLFSCRRPSPR